MSTAYCGRLLILTNVTSYHTGYWLCRWSRHHGCRRWSSERYLCCLLLQISPLQWPLWSCEAVRWTLRTN